MKLEHSFVVPVPVDDAWPVLLDVERIAPCLPGATLATVTDEEFTGRVKVKVGPMTITYRGSARFLERDEAARRVVIEANGKEARGSGTAKATVTATMHAAGESTDVEVVTDLALTGRPAQFGRGVMAEVGGKLIGRFADCLAEEISQPASAPNEQPGPEAAEFGAAEPTPAPAIPAPAIPAPAIPAPAIPAEPAATEPAATETTPEPGPPVQEDASAPEPQPEPDRSQPTAEVIDLFETASPSLLKRAVAATAGLAAIGAVGLLIRRQRRR